MLIENRSPQHTSCLYDIQLSSNCHVLHNVNISKTRVSTMPGRNLNKLYHQATYLVFSYETGADNT